MGMDKIRLSVYPVIAVKRQSFDNSTFIISIVSPGMEHVDIDCRNILRVKFHDIQQEYVEGGIRYKPLEYETAQQIVSAAFDNRDKSHWVIHCEAGVSRSPAVALGLAKYVRFSKTVKALEREFPYHNKYVRKLIEQAGDEQMKRIMKDLMTGE
jgi:predicted protein tyrosine phosphatase